MIINAENLILGRMASYVAKRALMGEEIKIVNCEKAVISGAKDVVLKKYQERVQRGAPLKGPYFHRMPDKIVKRSIKNMLPHKTRRGQEIYKKIRCYLSIPEEFKSKHLETIQNANIAKTKSLKYVQLLQLSRLLGAKI